MRVTRESRQLATPRSDTMYSASPTTTGELFRGTDAFLSVQATCVVVTSPEPVGSTAMQVT